MLTKADDFPIHQTPEPIAFSGTDRNFYDRYFFNGMSPDGSNFFALAFGVYPHLNIADAHFATIRDGKEYCIHASKHLNMERMDLEVGPIKIEVIEPLQKLKVTVTGEFGINAELVFDGFGFPIQEPRFIHRFGPRAFMDYTRMTQSGGYTGWIEVDGDRRGLASETWGIRDRSWGIRNIGDNDPQPFAPPIAPGFFWTWSPFRVGAATYYFHICADGKGDIWNIRAARAPDGGSVEAIEETSDCELRHHFKTGTRYPAKAELDVSFNKAPPVRIEFQPQYRFLMRGIGYFHPDWQHGRNQGPLRVEREDIDLASINELAP
ncbi:MAG: hypothetical protein KDA95_07350, partial [Acidimicrobiales bacterium]|nr:hypothetical protein [Acidimicrobiales bacterium]